MISALLLGAGVVGAGAILFADKPLPGDTLISDVTETDDFSIDYSMKPAKPIIDYETGEVDNSPDANLAAFLYVLRMGESSDNYAALCGGGNFTDYRQHPAIKTAANPVPWQGYKNSHAAGAYQAQPGTWSDYRKATGAPESFAPDAQDAFAVWDLKRRGAYDDVLAGNISAAMYKLRAEWTSLADRGAAWVGATFSNNGGTFA